LSYAGSGVLANGIGTVRELNILRWLLLFYIPWAFAGPDFQALVMADNDRANWLTHGRTYSETRQSPLVQINSSNVDGLGLAWSFDTGTRRGLEASPIVVDGVIYTTAAWSKVFANNAVTGELLWHFDPQVPKQWGANACCDVVNRGVAVLDDRVFVGTIDGRLIALDRYTGELVWEILTIDNAKPYTITGAPRVIKDMVVIGNGGAEYGVRGYVSAYSVDSGDLKWRFYTVPGDPRLPAESEAMEMARQTWTGDVYWQTGGGGTVWDSMAYDPDLDLLYIGVGNGSPWNRHLRSPGGGDNLFLSSIVALNASTGSYVWHYQTTPADTWDYTATQHIVLADLLINGETRQVLMQAPKNGFFYVLDRRTGQFISAENYVPVSWASHIDKHTGRPVETATAEHFDSSQFTRPGPFGGHNWQPMAFNESLGLMYIPAMENVSVYNTDEAFEYIKGPHWNTGQDDEANLDGPSVEQMQPLMQRLLTGMTLAWDPVKQEEIWRIEHNTMWNGGLLTTASNLVFQGTGEGRFAAYDAKTGDRLWETNVGNGIIAPPISYEVNGQQYIAVMAGWGGAVGLVLAESEAKGGGPGRLLVYKLGGTADLPRSSEEPGLIRAREVVATEALLENGLLLYTRHCMRCHGMGVTNKGLTSDLRRMSEDTHRLFKPIVLEGLYRSIGMIGFADVLSEDEVNNIHQYINATANSQLEEQQQPEWLTRLEHWVLDKVGLILSKVL